MSSKWERELTVRHNIYTADMALAYAIAAELKGAFIAAKLYLDTAIRIEANQKRKKTGDNGESSMASQNLSVLVNEWPEDPIWELEASSSNGSMIPWAWMRQRKRPKPKPKLKPNLKNDEEDI